MTNTDPFEQFALIALTGEDDDSLAFNVKIQFTDDDYELAAAVLWVGTLIERIGEERFQKELSRFLGKNDNSILVVTTNKRQTVH